MFINVKEFKPSLMTEMIRYYDLQVEDIDKLLGKKEEIELNEETVNRKLETGPNAGMSVACIIVESYGNKLTDEHIDKLSLLINSDTLNTIFSVWNHSLAFLLSCSRSRRILTANNYRLASLITYETLNYLSINGLSPALCLSFHLNDGDDSGLKILAADDYRLASLITDKTLHRYADNGDGSVLFNLVLSSSGREFLAVDNNPLASLIASKDFVREICIYVSGDLTGIKLLAAHNYRLASLITSNILNSYHKLENYGIDTESFSPSIASNLANSPEGREILAHDDYRLLSLINEETIEYVVVNLSKSPEGREILALDDYRLLELIMDQKAASHVIVNLSKSPEGREILARDEHRFLNLIMDQDYASYVIVNLAKIPEAIEILAFDDYLLFDLIDERDAYYVVCSLSESPEGMAILAHDDYILASLININIDFSSCYDVSTFKLFVLNLLKNPIGLEFLAADNYRLASLIYTTYINNIIIKNRITNIFYLSEIRSISLAFFRESADFLLSNNKKILLIVAQNIDLKSVLNFEINLQELDDILLENLGFICTVLAVKYESLKDDGERELCLNKIKEIMSVFLMNCEKTDMLALLFQSRLVNCLFEDLDVSAELLFNLSRELIKRINSYNVEEINYILLNLTAKVKNELDFKNMLEELKSLWIQFYSHIEARDFSIKMLEFSASGLQTQAAIDVWFKRSSALVKDVNSKNKEEINLILSKLIARISELNIPNDQRIEELHKSLIEFYSHTEVTDIALKSLSFDFADLRYQAAIVALEVCDWSEEDSEPAKKRIRLR